MLRSTLLTIAIVSVCTFSGCGGVTVESELETPADAGAGSGSHGSGTHEDAGSSAKADTAKADTGSTSANTIELSSENTLIQFVGTHSGDKPDPRTGKFEAFSGTVELGEAGISSLAVEIDTSSLTTDLPKLTEHLKNTDFFSVREHPTASFKMASIEGEGDSQTLSGELTLLGVTKPISFPATVTVDGGKLKMTAEFEIDRTEFGMNYGLEKIEKAVTMTIEIDA